MSTTERAARVLKSLKDEEWRTLAGLEEAATGHGTADVGRLSRMSRLPSERVRFAVGQAREERAGQPPGFGVCPDEGGG